MCICKGSTISQKSASKSCCRGHLWRNGLLRMSTSVMHDRCWLQHTTTHFNTLQHTATHCSENVWLCSAPPTTHCNTLQHAATRCNTLQHAATRCNTLQPHYNTLQHFATHCNTLHHNATRCNTPRCMHTLCVMTKSYTWHKSKSIKAHCNTL